MPWKSTTILKKMVKLLLDDDKPLLAKMLKLVNQPIKIVAKDFQDMYFLDMPAEEISTRKTPECAEPANNLKGKMWVPLGEYPSCRSHTPYCPIQPLYKPYIGGICWYIYIYLGYSQGYPTFPFDN